ncbi:RIP metalloprotease RseP [uncultured Planktosalinus sp.]|uniref:RIP metalloprotease RseP n=1 Tax=uncultured Planktosalinus sp. TaxID=1810935 RepID=UPI0030DC97CF
MDPFFVKAIQLILSLSILIVLHELGHFIPAKLFKTRVEKFYLFFDVKFSLFKKKIGETTYGIGWLPLGGYVKISGMIDESMDKEQMAKPPEPWEFRSKPTWQRLIIMLGGVTVNIILGFLIYTLILFNYGRDFVTPETMPDGFAVHESFKEMGFQDGDQILKVNGEPFENVTDINKYLLLRDVTTVEVLHQNGSTETISVPEDIGMTNFKAGILEPFVPLVNPVIDVVAPDSPAEKAGLQKEDRIVFVNGEETNFWHEFTQKVKSSTDEPVSLVVERNGEIINFDIKPDENNVIGVAPLLNFDVVHKKYTLWESITQGSSFGYDILRDYVAQFKYVFTQEGATQVGGFGAIGNLFPDTWDWYSFWMTTAFISIILAFMNILPIPALDGGHVVFLLYEMVSGRKPNEKVMEYAQMIGFFILIALVLFANGNDVYRWLFG